MGHAVFSGQLIARSGVYYNTAVCYRTCCGMVHHPDAVGECVKAKVHLLLSSAQR
jgi:hypothetical protein